MLTRLRRQVNEAMADLPVRRKPGLRRASQQEALLATDLPLVALEGALEAFCSRMAQMGWTVHQKGQWLLLDAPVPMPEIIGIPHATGEAACCLWLLRRHPGGTVDQNMLRALVKAQEAGRQPLERLCAQWHQCFAAMLRQKETLPGGLLPYLCEALKEEKA